MAAEGVQGEDGRGGGTRGGVFVDRVAVEGVQDADRRGAGGGGDEAALGEGQAVEGRFGQRLGPEASAVGGVGGDEAAAREPGHDDAGRGGGLVGCGGELAVIAHVQRKGPDAAAVTLSDGGER